MLSDAAVDLSDDLLELSEYGKADGPGLLWAKMVVTETAEATMIGEPVPV